MDIFSRLLALSRKQPGIIRKGKKYVKPGQKPPKGVVLHRGKRGGIYYLIEDKRLKIQGKEHELVRSKGITRDQWEDIRQKHLAEGAESVEFINKPENEHRGGKALYNIYVRTAGTDKKIAEVAERNKKFGKKKTTVIRRNPIRSIEINPLSNPDQAISVCNKILNNSNKKLDDLKQSNTEKKLIDKQRIAISVLRFITNIVNQSIKSGGWWNNNRTLFGVNYHEDGSIAGSHLFHIDKEDNSVQIDLVATADVTRRGSGSQSIEVAKQYARDNGVKLLRLTSVYDSYSFYRKLGFNRVGKTNEFIKYV
jgi:N-acetylglutamate synthase-like GNAT family acetyltransferase